MSLDGKWIRYYEEKVANNPDKNLLVQLIQAKTVY